ncbi:hypothetical protein Taro_025965 [Colocasia esculenta]|uniref:Uncharacterized protein n=1 Tax=Colocasia esculenta TaxID=4460 RepID=A0A843VJ63_COLES|nr:hypothetical protein [Colocasia esculenta]
MASRGRRCAQARDDKHRHEERGEQQAPAPQGPMVLHPPPPLDYGVFMQGLVQAMQTRAQTQAALQAQLQAQAQAPAPIPQEHGHGGPSIMERSRMVAFDHRTLDEALSAACRQESKMDQYLEEKREAQKRSAPPFQREDKKKEVVYQSPQCLAALSHQAVAVEPYCRKVPMARLNVYVISCGHQDEILEVDKYHWPMFIEKLEPHNIQTYTEMVQRAQLVEDTMAKVEGMKGKDVARQVFVKKGVANNVATFQNNNNNNTTNNNQYNNNKRPSTGKDYNMDKKVKT